MLTEAKLRKRVYEATFKRGSSLFNAGGVLEMEEEDQGDRMLIRAKVQGSGSRAYDVKLLMDESEDKNTAQNGCLTFFLFQMERLPRLKARIRISTLF